MTPLAYAAAGAIPPRTAATPLGRAASAHTTGATALATAAGPLGTAELALAGGRTADLLGGA